MAVQNPMSGYYFDRLREAFSDWVKALSKEPLFRYSIWRRRRTSPPKTVAALFGKPMLRRVHGGRWSCQSAAGPNMLGESAEIAFRRWKTACIERSGLSK